MVSRLSFKGLYGRVIVSRFCPGDGGQSGETKYGKMDGQGGGGGGGGGTI
jgi:hypothetical protein